MTGKGEDFSFDVVEWWDHEGNYHDSNPSSEELLQDATQLTVHMMHPDGSDAGHFTAHSPIGWTEGMLDIDVDDAYHHGHYDD